MVYISYQQDIQEAVLRLKENLESHNLTCWMDMKNEGDVVTEEMTRMIRECKVSILDPSS